MVAAADRHFQEFDNRALAMGQMDQESSCRATVTAWDGGMGLMQFMPATYKDVVARGICPSGNAYHPEWNIDCGMRYLRYLFDRMREYMPEQEAYYAALAAYNYGRGWVNRDNRVCRKLKFCEPSRYLGNVQYSNDRRRSAKHIEWGRTYVPHVIRRSKKYYGVVRL